MDLVANPSDSLSELARYLNTLRGDESIRSVAKRADVSHSVVADLLLGRKMPSTDMVLAIGRALNARPLLLLRIMGAIEEPEGEFVDARIAHLARELDKLPPHLREQAVEALGVQVDAFRTLNEELELYYGLLREFPDLEEWIRQRRAKRDDASADTTPPDSG